MPIYLSSAAKSRINTRFPAVFNGGRIDVYTGPQPPTANHTPTGTRVAQVTANGGLQFVVAGNVIIKDPAQSWVLQGLDTGVAGWFRLISDQFDPGYLSEDYARMDGMCWPLEDPHTGLVMPALPITPATVRDIEGFVFTI